MGIKDEKMTVIECNYVKCPHLKDGKCNLQNIRISDEKLERDEYPVCLTGIVDVVAGEG